MVLIMGFLYDTLSKQQVGTKMKKPQVPYILGIITSVIEAAAKTTVELLFEMNSLIKKERVRNTSISRFLPNGLTLCKYT